MSSEYIPLVSWETKLVDVQPVLARPFHYICKVSSVNPNDYDPNELGENGTLLVPKTDRFYIVDYTGKIYQIKYVVDVPTKTVEIYDLTEDADEGPYISESAFVYQTRNGINVLTQAQRKRLHPSAIDQIWNIENNIIRTNYNFLDLTDTPSAYTDQAGFIPKVNVGETALEFLDPSTDWLSQYALLAGRNGNVLKIDQIDEFNSGAGVTIDGVLIKDSEIGFTYLDKYTNLTPMPEDVGGAEEGTTFNEVSIDQVLTTILYPYQYPAFKTFTIQSQTTPLEVGASIAANRVFTWTTNLVGDANINAGSIVIRDVTGNANIATGLSYTNTPYTSTYGAITKTTATTNQFSITGTNSKSETFNKTYTVTWYWRIYWGTSANTSLTEAQIKLLADNALVSSAIGTKTFAAGDYKYFCIPAAPVFTSPVSFKDSAGFEVAMTKLTDVNITNTHLQALDYAVYRTSYPQVSALTITIS